MLNKTVNKISLMGTLALGPMLHFFYLIFAVSQKAIFNFD